MIVLFIRASSAYEKKSKSVPKTFMMQLEEEEEEMIEKYSCHIA